MIRYAIAKYVDDLSRNEPVNIGVFAFDGDQAVARFDGEDEETGKLDLRRVRGVAGTKAYRAWTEYWRAVIADPGGADRALKGVPAGDSRAVEYLIERRSQNFYLDFGGTVLVDVEDQPLGEARDRLFARLVRQPDPPPSQSLAQKSRKALAAAGAPLEDDDRYKEQVRVSLDVPGLDVDQEVSYAVKNGDWHYLQEMPFDPDKPRRSNKEATHCAFLFEHSPVVRESGVILYDSTDISIGQYRLLEMLMRYGPTVDVHETDSAATKLIERLSLG